MLHVDRPVEEPPERFMGGEVAAGRLNRLVHHELPTSREGLERRNGMKADEEAFVTARLALCGARSAPAVSVASRWLC